MANRRTLSARRLKTLILTLITLTTSVVPFNLPLVAAETTPTILTGPAEVAIFSDTYGSSTISDPNLTPGTSFTVEITAGNAPPFNGYDLFLYYDPNYILAQSVDVATGTVFDTPFVLKTDLFFPGSIRLAVVNLGSSFDGGTGTLAHVNFQVTGVGVSPLTLAEGLQFPSTFAQSSSRLVLGTTPIDTTTTDGYFTNVIDKLGPAADFTTIPTNPEMGQTVIFDATASFDQDNDLPATRGIRRYNWDFGDGLATTSTFPFIAHRFEDVAFPGFFPFSGNFSVRLTAIDTDDFQGMTTRRVEVSTTPTPLDNFAITTDTTDQFPLILAPGDTGTATVTIISLGNFIGTLTLTATSAPSLANGPAPKLGQSTIDIGIGATRRTSLTVSTTGNTPPGNYAVIVTGTSNQLTNSGLAFVLVKPLEPAFARGKLTWTHRLSLSASGNTQTWTARISNPNPGLPIQSHVQIFGNGATGSFFVAQSEPFTLQGGETRSNILTTQTFTNADIGTKFMFTAVIVWTLPSTGETLVSSSTKSGSFLVIP